MPEYRFRRADQRNLVIEKKRQSNNDDLDHWTVVFYCGNNVKSVIRGLLEVALADYTPEDEKLSDAVKSLELELVFALGRIEEIAKEIVNG
jgi:hypothetical protein